MVKDHSDSDRQIDRHTKRETDRQRERERERERERDPLPPPHGIHLSSSSKGFLYALSHRQDITYHNLCYTSRGALAGTINISVGNEGLIRRPIAH